MDARWRITAIAAANATSNANTAKEIPPPLEHGLHVYSNVAA